METSAAAKGNLPAEHTSFVGRRRLLQDVKFGLSATRLLTLVGPGGVGKTRLALRAATALQRATPDGVWMVELAGLTDGQLVPKAVMTTFGMRDQSGTWPTSQLVEHIADRRLIIVLDNCEHLLDACAVLIERLLRGAPEVRVLATSRQALGVPGERVLPVTPLTLPATDGNASIERLAQSEAVALLLSRAAEATGEFRLTDENRVLVVDLCRRLDGMPLAIELAAVRLRALGLEQVVERLHDRFRLLTGGSRSALPRQQTLRATIDWSYELLSERERTVLRRLAVFAGTFDIEGAEIVCASEDVDANRVLDPLSTLVERSFVTREGTLTTARYRLHETMREYALMRLREAGDEHAARRAHMDYYLDVGRRAEMNWFGRGFVEWLNRLEVEADNIRVVLHRCLEDDSDVEAGLQLAASVWFYWQSRAVSEGAHWLDALLDRAAGSDAARARALRARGTVALLEQDLTRGRSALSEAVDLSRRLQDVDTLVHSLCDLSLVQTLSGDLVRGQATANEVADIAHASQAPIWWASSAQAQGAAASYARDFPRARGAYQRLKEVCEANDEAWMLSYGYLNLGTGLLLAQQDSEEARHYLEAGLRLKRQVDDRAGIMLILVGLAYCAAAVQQPMRAARLLGAIAQVRRNEGTQTPAILSPLVSEAHAQAELALGTERFARAYQEGTRLDRAGAVSLALGEQPERRKQSASTESSSPLGRRELEIAALIAEGMTSKQIATQLFLSQRTVETHISNILNKLGFNSRAQIAGWASSRT